MQPATFIPLIVASAMFMQQLDSTAVATALPSIAASLGVPALSLHPVITVYMLAMAGFIPVSGWVADKYGARRIFCVAMALFVVSSAMCGFATSLAELIFLRALQGMSAAMMIPVARLIVVKSIPKSELVGALGLMSMPALIGPLVGPLLGGAIVTIATWQWIFWLNIPVGLLGMALALRYVPEIKEKDVQRFDVTGTLLAGGGLAAFLFGVDVLVSSGGQKPNAWLCAIAGVGLLALYVRHAGRKAHPAIDLKLLKLKTLRASVTGGSMFRIGVGAMPFLLPLMLQQGFAMSALKAGLVTSSAAVGALLVKSVAKRIIRRFGFRNLLVWNAIVASIFIAACGLFNATTPLIVMMLVVFFGGLFRSVEFTAINALAYDETTPSQTSHATALTQMAQRVSFSLGVTIPSIVLHLATTTPGHTPTYAYTLAFAVVGGLSMVAAYVFSRLDADVGSELSGRRKSLRTENQ